MDTIACNFDDHHVARRDESNITAVELAAVNHELAVDSLLWCADLLMKKHRRSSIFLISLFCFLFFFSFFFLFLCFACVSY